MKMQWTIVDCSSTDSDEYPGIDYKSLVRPVSNKMRKSHGHRFMGRLAQRFGDPEVMEELQQLNPNGATIIDIEPWPQVVSIGSVDPLSTLSFPRDFNDAKCKCDGLTSQSKYLNYTGASTEPEGFLEFPKILMKSLFWNFKTPKDLKYDLSPHIAAVNFKWQNHVVISQNSASKCRKFAPICTTVTVPFNSKNKYAQEVRQLCNQIAQTPNDLIHLLDANNPTANGPFTVLESDNFVIRTFRGNSEDLHIYDDQFQQKVILVPLRSKQGYETSCLNYIHAFPILARFKLGTKVLERKFDLNLKMTVSPQQYCLAFFFPNKTGIATVVRIVLSVYTIFPVSYREAQLTALFPQATAKSKLAKLPEDDECVKGEFNPDRLASDFVSFIRSDMASDSFRNRDKQFKVSYEAGWRHHQKNTEKYRYRRRGNWQDRLYYLVEKHKKKQEIFVNMKTDFSDWIPEIV